MSRYEPLVTLVLAPGEPQGLAPPSHLDLSTPLGAIAAEYLKALLARDRRRGLTLIHEAADGGVEVAELYLQVFAPVLQEVGRLRQLGEATVGQEHLVMSATELAMAQLYPRTFATPRNGRTIVVAAVGGDLHEVGARMMADLFELDGWDSDVLRVLVGAVVRVARAAGPGLGRRRDRGRLDVRAVAAGPGGCRAV